ncbi:tripartite motif-containing protein 47 [Alligator sinensis]|uniref:Tripartite motif-containing protein 47 n=1 Tax=Alligator sinensis TaxID=38654 RepID=A0A1U7R738_ALLSI|nr:tripartite motif-containing protein 47 [Alligator sinensis]
MASLGSQKLEEKLVCSICLELFREAVTIPCGHNFCQKCISNHWDKQEKEDPQGEERFTCPDCRKGFKTRLELKKNVSLCSVVELVKAGEVQASSTDMKAPADRGKCPRHGRPLELYCQEEKVCICCVCTVKECRDHHRVLFEEERKKKQALLEEFLEKTQQEAAKIEEEKHKLEETTEDIKESSEKLKSGVLNKFALIIEALEKQRRQAVERIEQEQATALGQIAENWAQLEHQQATLSQHQEKARALLACTDGRIFLEDFLQLPSETLEALPAIEFNAASKVDPISKILTEVSRLLLEDLPKCLNPEVTGPETKEPMEPKVPTVLKAGPPLLEYELRAGLLKDHRDLTFDPDTANRHLQLSSHNQRASHPRSHNDQGQNQANRFELWQVLCTQGYGQGHHYWEVGLSSHSIVVGVTYKSIQRKKQDGGHKFNIGKDGSSWGLQIREECYLAWHNGQSLKVKEPLYKWIGVSLDCDIGCLSFYGIGDKMKLLHRFYCDFREPLYPVFWLCEGRTVILYLRPLDAYCRACPACVCPLCRAQDHRAHDVVPLEQERDLKEAQRPKILSDVENQLDELGVVIAQTRKTVELIKSTALKEKDIVSKLFAVATRALETFQKEVATFIEDDEQSMLAEAEEYLRQKEERRAKLAQCKQNLEQVSSTDALCFLQEFQALKIAAEENNSPGPSFQKELSFTKSSQVVCAVKELLVTACKSQWDQLLGKGADGAGFHDMQEVIAEPQLSDKPSNPACSETRDYFLKFAFIIDLDSDTADKFIQLFGTKGAKRVLNPIAYPESSTRFINCEQVLGENMMNRGNYYWEVEIIDGWVSIGVITDDFNSRESYDRGRLGRNEKSCCLQWNGQNYVAWFGGFESVIQQPFFHTIGVYLEYSEKALTFFGVKDSKMTCLQQLKVSRFKKGMFDPFQNKINHQFPSLFAYNLKPAFFLESVDAHLQLGPLKRDCVSVLKRR